ncbi:MAG: T9SS type A sorting domain-containing protein [Bacteroidetes bacterium]|nr:MAG: T9SS type A sorting domain-containing protein [Bacteroidota bacterium]
MKTIFTFLFAIVLFSSQAQVLNTIKYDTTNSGLPDNSIWGMDITSGDVLWLNVFGQGVVSFNGTTWTQYNTSTVNFPGNYVDDVVVDNSNNVWVAAQGLVAKFNGVSWATMNTGNGLTDCLSKDASGNIWASDNGLSKYNGTAWSMIAASHPSGTSGPQEVVVDQNNNVWLTYIGETDVTMYSQTTSTWTHYDTSNVSLFSPQWWYTDIEVTHDNKIIVAGNGDSTLYFNGTTWGLLDQLSGQNMSVIKDVTVRNNVSWFGMCNGFGLGSYNGTAWKKYTTNPSYIPMMGIRFDSQGYLWMATLDGLYKVTTNTLDVNDPNSLNDVALLYPNPSDGIMILKFISANFQKAEALVFDVSGKQVYASGLEPAENELDLTHLPAGVYTLNMRTDNGSYFQKIVLH